MKKTKLTLGKLSVKSFTTAKAQTVRGGESANRICASYYNCETRNYCETVNITACYGDAGCKRY
ncbi:MAG: hypothetical protein WBH03_10750 [Cyclobacteriaceae bacterium]